MDGKVTPQKPVNLVIDGARLRQLREKAGLSVSALARMAALSKNQIEQLESGGDSLFYNPGVKRQAARKLAALLGVDPKTVLTDPDERLPSPLEIPATVAHTPHAPSPEISLRNTESVVPTHAGPAPASQPNAKTDQIVTPALGEAVHVQLAGEQGSGIHGPSSKKKASKTWLWTLMVLLGGLTAAGGVAWQQGLLTAQTLDEWVHLADDRLGITLNRAAVTQPAPLLPATAPAHLPPVSEAGASPALVVGTSVPASAMPTADTPSSTSAAMVAATAATEPPPICPVRQSNLAPSYAPQANKIGDRVNIITTKPVTVCVQDATGEQWVLDVKPNVPRTVRGKSPWWIASHQIDDIQIFYQGWRVVEAKTEGQQILLRERALAKSAN